MYGGWAQFRPKMHQSIARTNLKITRLMKNIFMKTANTDLPSISKYMVFVKLSS